MKVTIAELSETGDREADTTILVVDEEVVIAVTGFGTGIFRWKAWGKQGTPYGSVEGMLDELFSGWAKDSNGWNGQETLGPALVWANPITFAHVVMDLINNQ